MTKKIRYPQDPEYTKRRFRKTVVADKTLTSLYFVEDVIFKDPTSFLVRDIETLESKEVTFDQILVENPPVGMSLFYNTALYVTRFPFRQYSQGLCWDNINCSTVLGDKVPSMRRENSVNGLSFLYNPCLGVYPCLDTAKEMFENGFRVVPLNRDVAVSKNGDVVFRGFKEPVGRFDFDKKEITLRPEFGFLSKNHTVSAFKGVS